MGDRRLAEAESGGEVADADRRLSLPQRGDHRQPGRVGQSLHQLCSRLGPALLDHWESAADAALANHRKVLDGHVADDTISIDVYRWILRARWKYERDQASGQVALRRRCEEDCGPSARTRRGVLPGRRPGLRLRRVLRG